MQGDWVWVWEEMGTIGSAQMLQTWPCACFHCTQTNSRGFVMMLKEAKLWVGSGRARTRIQVVWLVRPMSHDWWELLWAPEPGLVGWSQFSWGASLNFVFQSRKLQSFSLWSVQETVRSIYFIHTCLKITRKWDRNIMTTLGREKRKYREGSGPRSVCD